ncbi:alpha-acetolactate decarboxylase [Brenneria goodwinii]|uniref:Alpha-acetolactate decarboxylase n=1 Tax=Brenneria goodwinii TaxID=1109412 RepID=A0A0G4JR56_9GAMM|nr:acetolactate decarboxylase [Brenneria goodwinii]ATA25348.1 alpha-acetolactate decarboxylase [Brenneria goodwinii]MCG8159029.1 acetolactate decarboxylase [Brenneria goodwinii]MCG8162687.1 acetolactate decarboxylase [Brenneria goodwinii]MCG8168281.1 acetolactate decarboxylase [Brenneria goodwinii]MCG8172907.1 acetolactate decarboxylase [Brenneria goodwinii]
MKEDTGVCHCAEEIAAYALDHQKHHSDCVIYQTSLMSGLINGVYEGSRTMAELLEHGDFGLGTFNNLDGELVAFNSNIFQLRSDGSARAARPDQKTPFAVMTFFKPTEEIHCSSKIDRHSLHQKIDTLIGTDNLFCALRIDGQFDYVETRTVPRQERPYKPMLEAIAQQPTFHFEHCQGSIIGFRSPAYTQGINVAGYHEHFITESREGGGHILDYQMKSGVLTFGVISKLIIDLPQDRDFLSANLSPENLDSAIQSVEG